MQKWTRNERHDDGTYIVEPFDAYSNLCWHFWGMPHWIIWLVDQNNTLYIYIHGINWYGRRFWLLIRVVRGVGDGLDFRQKYVDYACSHLPWHNFSIYSKYKMHWRSGKPVLSNLIYTCGTCTENGKPYWWPFNLFGLYSKKEKKNQIHWLHEINVYVNEYVM